MENKKQPESLELSAQELEAIAGGAAEYQPEPRAVEYPSGDLYNEVSKKVSDSLQGSLGGGYTYYKKEEYYLQSPDSSNGGA